VSEGFVYAIAVTGTTGRSGGDMEALRAAIDAIKAGLCRARPRGLRHP
jgi:tryptophan synthase alpha subunit